MDSLTLLYDCKTKVLQRFFIAKNNKRKHRFLHVPRFFSIIMDMPESLSADPQVLQQLDKLAFINSIQFGRKVILVIESNIDYDKLQEAIDNLLKSKEVSQKELAILANSNIRLMTIGNKEIKDINPDNPFTSILTYLSSTVTPDDFGGPISFSASNIKDNSVFVNYFNVQ